MLLIIKKYILLQNWGRIDLREGIYNKLLI